MPKKPVHNLDISAIFKINDVNNAMLEFDSKQVEIMNLSRDDLLSVFRYIYENPDALDFDVAFEEIRRLPNPVEQEVTKQILNKLNEFNDNSEIIRKEINEKFPGL